MEKEKLNAYAARVTQANRSELVVIIYEAFLDSVAARKQFLKDENMSECRREIERARGFLTELMGSLDFSYEIAHYLRRLYVFAYHELCHGVALRDEERFTLQEMAKPDDSASVMANTETIYAGLTYGRDSLNESVGVDGMGNRGFQA